MSIFPTLLSIDTPRPRRRLPLCFTRLKFSPCSRLLLLWDWYFLNVAIFESMTGLHGRMLQSRFRVHGGRTPIHVQQADGYEPSVFLQRAELPTLSKRKSHLSHRTTARSTTSTPRPNHIARVNSSCLRSTSFAATNLSQHPSTRFYQRQEDGGQLLNIRLPQQHRNSDAL